MGLSTGNQYSNRGLVWSQTAGSQTRLWCCWMGGRETRRDKKGGRLCEALVGGSGVGGWGGIDPCCFSAVLALHLCSSYFSVDSLGRQTQSRWEWNCWSCGAQLGTDNHKSELSTTDLLHAAGDATRIEQNRIEENSLKFSTHSWVPPCFLFKYLTRKRGRELDVGGE